MNYHATNAYTLSIGFNDKDSKKQELTDAKILAIITKTAKQFFEAFTLRPVQIGFWDGEQEKSVDLFIINGEDEEVASLCSLLCERLNQESIAVCKTLQATCFFSK